MSLVGFKAKNHPQQVRRDGANDDVDDRRTPQHVFGPLHRERRFTVDAAASDANALLPVYWTRETNGLAQSWDGHRVWCNPPYSDIQAWITKAWMEMYMTRCELVVMLLPANRCEQPWWQDGIEQHRDGPVVEGIRLTTRFLGPGRLRFNWPPDRVVPKKGDRPPYGCVLVTWERAT
jgi:phage N-6-adenine-methyltransferase